MSKRLTPTQLMAMDWQHSWASQRRWVRSGSGSHHGTVVLIRPVKCWTDSRCASEPTGPSKILLVLGFLVLVEIEDHGTLPISVPHNWVFFRFLINSVPSPWTVWAGPIYLHLGPTWHSNSELPKLVETRKNPFSVKISKGKIRPKPSDSH